MPAWYTIDKQRRLVLSAAYGLARMYGILRELSGESGVHVFHTLDEALQWVLGDNAAS